MRADQLHYTLQFDVQPGKMPEFEILAQKACDACLADEPGTLVYRWQIDGSGSKVQLHERFIDDAAMLVHANGPVATEIFPALMEISEVTRFDVHGDPGAEAAAKLAEYGAAVYTGWKGFDR